MRNKKTETNGASFRLHSSAPSRNLEHTERLFDGNFKVGIGVYDGISALLAQKWKFDFAWVSSFCCSAVLGLPDAGIVGSEEILGVVRCVRRSIDLPIVVDLDSGYGDSVKVFHVVEAMARAGSTALCIEDNPSSKRCSLYDRAERTLASIDEHVTRLRAACAALKAACSACRIIARTEALVAGLGVDEALKRATAYADVGAHAVFIQSLDSTGKEVLSFARAWNRRTPLFIAPTRLPSITKKEFARAGISHTIFANQGLRAAHAAIDKAFGILARSESAAALGSEISPVSTVASLVGAEKIAELESAFGAKADTGVRAAGNLSKIKVNRSRGRTGAARA